MKNIYKGECPKELSFLRDLSKKNLTWEDFSNPENKRYKEQKEFLHKCLVDSQHGQCVYCECPIKGNSHIEHFVPRSVDNRLIFAWENLFISCNCVDSCGHYKDSQKGKGTTPNQMFRPNDTEINISDCFDCVGGELRPKASLKHHLVSLVNGTIQRTNLNNSRLLARRDNFMRELFSSVDKETWKSSFSIADLRVIYAEKGFDSLIQLFAERYCKE